MKDIQHPPTIRTDRLVLRQWKQEDLEQFANLNIDEDHRRKGLGTALIKWLENLASQEGYNEIGIGVGLYKDYGPAQQLYFQLGYIPEGNGITYKGQPTVPGQSYPLDDDLILWLMKRTGPALGITYEKAGPFHF